MANDAFIVNSNCSFEFRIYTITRYNTFSFPLSLSLSLCVCKCLNCNAFCKSHIIFVHLCDRNLSFLSLDVSLFLITFVWTNRHKFVFGLCLYSFHPPTRAVFACIALALCLTKKACLTVLRQQWLKEALPIISIKRENSFMCSTYRPLLGLSSLLNKCLSLFFCSIFVQRNCYCLRKKLLKCLMKGT